MSYRQSSYRGVDADTREFRLSADVRTPSCGCLAHWAISNRHMSNVSNRQTCFVPEDVLL